MTVSPNAPYAYQVKFSSVLRGCSIMPAGMVTLTVVQQTSNGPTPLPGQSALLQPDGTATFLFTQSVPGTYTLQATYQGGPSFDSSATGTFDVIVAEKRVTVLPEAAGNNCTHGGQRIETGLDGNGDGLLTGDEVSSTQFVCNGAPGATGDAGVPGMDGSNGHASLVTVTAEAAGNNCHAGGKRIDVGLDLDDDGTLAASEVTSTFYACNGAAGPAGNDGSAGNAGANGADGSSGKNSLVSIADEAAGANCPAGGKALLVGLDADGNGKLEGNEATSTSYVCNGQSGAEGPAGAAACNTTGAAPAAWMLALAAASVLRRRRNG